MPSSHTILAASSVARSMSFDAPLVIWPRHSSSATRPAMRIAIWASMKGLEWLWRSASGSCIVTPRARPRGMIVTLCSGSASGSSAATTAWPASWYAQVTRSCSLITTDLRSTPISTLSRAASRSALATVERPARAAIRAASLTRFARSAPENPGVPRAIERRSTSGFERDGARVDAQDLLASLEIGIADGHLPVEPPGPEQRRIEDVGAVGGRHDHDAVAAREAVHLHEQLVERLLALFVTERMAAAVASHRVELVDEDDARGMAARLAKQLAHARGAHAGVHLDEVGAAGRDEGHARLAGHRAREQRLAGAGRSDEQDAARDAAADRGEAARLLQEVDDLPHFVLGLVHARRRR